MSKYNLLLLEYCRWPSSGYKCGSNTVMGNERDWFPPSLGSMTLHYAPGSAWEGVGRLWVTLHSQSLILSLIPTFSHSLAKMCPLTQENYILKKNNIGQHNESSHVLLLYKPLVLKDAFSMKSWMIASIWLFMYISMGWCEVITMCVLYVEMLQLMVQLLIYLLKCKTTIECTHFSSCSFCHTSRQVITSKKWRHR